MLAQTQYEEAWTTNATDKDLQGQKSPHPLVQWKLKDQVQIFGVETLGTTISSIPIHLLRLLHLLPKALSSAQLTIFGVSLSQMTDPSISSPLAFSGGSHQSSRAGLVSWSFSLICIFMIFALAFHAFKSFPWVIMSVSLLLLWTCCLLSNDGKAPLCSTHYKERQKYRMFYAEGEQKPKKKHMEQLDHTQEEISKWN